MTRTSERSTHLVRNPRWFMTGFASQTATAIVGSLGFFEALAGFPGRFHQTSALGFAI